MGWIYLWFEQFIDEKKNKTNRKQSFFARLCCLFYFRELCPTFLYWNVSALEVRVSIICTIFNYRSIYRSYRFFFYFEIYKFKRESNLALRLNVLGILTFNALLFPFPKHLWGLVYFYYESFFYFSMQVWHLMIYVPFAREFLSSDETDFSVLRFGFSFRWTIFKICMTVFWQFKTWRQTLNKSLLLAIKPSKIMIRITVVQYSNLSLVFYYK